MSPKSKYMVLLTTLFALILGALSVSAQDDPVVIQWYVGLGAGGQPEQIAAQEAITEAFNSSRDDIQLEILIVDNTVAYDTLGTLIATSDAPDIVGPVGLDGSNAFAGNYLDLEPIIEEVGYDLNQFDQAAVDSYRTADGLIGLPFATFPSFIYYRRPLFDEAGLNYPPQEFGAPYVMPDGTEVEWNMDTLREIGMFLTVDAEGFDATEEEFDAENIIQWGFISQWNDEPRGQTTLFGAANPIDEDGNAVIPEPWRVGLQWFYDGIWVDNFIPNASQNGSDILASGNAFSSGNVAMAHTHLWYTCCLGEVTDDWDIAVVPSYNGTYTAKLHGDTFRILSGTDHPVEAFEVLAYLLGDASETLLQVYGGMPARAEDTEAFFANLDETYPQGVNWQVAIDSLSYADSPNHESILPNYNRVRDLLGALETEYESTPDLDMQARLDTLQEELQALYDGTAEEVEEEAESEDEG